MSSRKNIPNTFLSYKIARALNTSVEYLITGKNPDAVYKIPEDLLEVMRKYIN